MAALEHFEQVGSRGFYRPVGEMSFEQAVERIAVGIEHARSLGLADLLVNGMGLTGFPVPTTFGRYAFAVRWAAASGGLVRVAIVVRPEHIDYEKIGMVMAKNRGMDADAFSTEADAIKWLESRAPNRV
jgi:hypothetical protein